MAKNIDNTNNTNNMKKRIKLTESDLHRVIKESVKRVLRESRMNKWETIDPWDLYWEGPDNEEDDEIYQLFDNTDELIRIDFDFKYEPGNDGDGYETPRESGYYNMYWEVSPHTDEFLRKNLSEEGYKTVLNSIEDYIHTYEDSIYEDHYRDEEDAYDSYY